LNNSYAAQITLLDILATNRWFESELFRLFFLQFLDEFMFYTKQIELSTRRSPTALLGRLKRPILSQFAVLKDFSQYINNLPHYISGEVAVHWETWGYDYLTLAVHYNLGLYAAESLKGRIISKDPLKHRKGRPLLDFALRREINRGVPLSRSVPDPELVNLILSHGADPNEEYESFSVWYLYLRHLSDRNLPKEAADGEGSPWSRTAEVMIEHGASRYPCGTFKQHTSLDVMDTLCELFGKEHTQRFEKCFEMQKPRKVFSLSKRGFLSRLSGLMK
jgi:hypothetical protein